MRLTLSCVMIAQIAAMLVGGLDVLEARMASYPEWTLRCKALSTADFSYIPDAPTQITEAKPMNAERETPAYCRVKGYVSPNVGFEASLPAQWNGRFIELGCAGHCGVIIECGSYLVREGYACVASDMGHQGAIRDGIWAYDNLQAKLDWGYRATHVTAIAGKHLVERFYQRSPKRSYFIGGSTGGRQGLQESQRFPWDFDGIVAFAPVVDPSTDYINWAWGIRVLHDVEGKPLLGREELKLLTEAAVAKCDMDDGVKDGVIGDPLHCGFDPEELACKTSQTSRCLSLVQVEAVKKFYSGPVNSHGEKASLGGPVVGSELGQWDRNPGLGWFSYLGFDDNKFEKLVTDGLRFMFFWPDPGPTWKLSDFDFDRDSRRLGIMQALYASSNPDLRPFKAAGGKLLVFHPLNDPFLPRKIIDYYETVEHTMGGREETQSFFRLFVVPGVGHGLGGEGADTIDYLSAIVGWVEDERAPDRVVAARLKVYDDAHSIWDPLDPAQVQFTRPLYPYPLKAKYLGRGDSNDAANFGPADK